MQPDKMRRLSIILLAWLTSLFIVPSAQAGPLCDWFGYCLYESPGFQIKVVDKETGQPLADVHVFAEWVLASVRIDDGPLVVQDAVSDADGVIKFPAWGPIRGGPRGLILNLDPGISFFKPGYKVLRYQNAYVEGTTETTRVHKFGEDGRTFSLELFRGTPEEWLKELDRAEKRFAGGVPPEKLLEVRDSHVNRYRRVMAELKKLPRRPVIDAHIETLQRNIERLEALR